jgi:hypothetical protein
MQIKQIASAHQWDQNIVDKILGNKPKEDKSVYESRFTPVDTPFVSPDFGGAIPTKSQPKMSDEQYENAIRELAREEASKGILAGTEGQRRLMREYVSVASPDRQAIYNQSMAKTGGKMNATYSFYDKLGNKSFHYNKGSSMWFWQGTSAEKAHKDRFTEIYTEAYTEYEAEHGKVKGTPRVDKFM